MRTTLAWCAALALVAGSVGCLGELIPGPPAPSTADMAHGGSGSGTGAGNGTGGNGAGSSDMAAQAAAPTDDGGSGAAGTKAFGDTCTVNGDCQSALCEQFVMGTVHRCTKACTAATQATDCPAPSDGMCTPNLYCKFDQ